MTEFSHGSGCGCKISPKVLEQMLHGLRSHVTDKNLLVGNHSNDDAAVYDIGNGQAIISTTDFFMPIVDDPFTFGQIAAVNAISDIYAMGGKPMMAIAIFGWPLDKLSTEVGRRVIEGGQETCARAGIALAGGHSIDAPEPIFGLAVTGQVEIAQLKRNNAAKAGDLLYLSKPLGIGIHTTAQKQKKLATPHQHIAVDAMLQLNQVGSDFAQIQGVHAMTDVTGFGLGGHLYELCHGSGLHATLHFSQLPTLPHTNDYLAQGCSPGGATRNFESYGHALSPLTPEQQAIICDPQTSGGLLIAVDKAAEQVFLDTARAHQLSLSPIGQLHHQGDHLITVQP